MDLNKVIAMLQSQIARRGVELADLELIYNIRKASAYTKHQYKVVRAIRDEIKPLAISQKFDRVVLRELTGKRTEQKRVEREFPLSVVDCSGPGPVWRRMNSNKFSFPG